MKPIKAGVLSDTHLHRADAQFKKIFDHCFQDCEVIIHAGDLVDAAVLEVMRGKIVHAVRGNMCTSTAQGLHPPELVFSLGGFTIALAHGAGWGQDIEDNLWRHFPEVDCIIYGHTHRPSLHRHGGILFLNPGAFQCASRHGAPATYAILEAGEKLAARIHEIHWTP